MARGGAYLMSQMEIRGYTLKGCSNWRVIACCWCFFSDNLQSHKHFVFFPRMCGGGWNAGNNRASVSFSVISCPHKSVDSLSDGGTKWPFSFFSFLLRTKVKRAVPLGLGEGGVTTERGADLIWALMCVCAPNFLFAHTSRRHDKLRRRSLRGKADETRPLIPLVPLTQTAQVHEGAR